MRRPRGNSGVPQEPRRSGVAGLYVVPRLEDMVADPGHFRVLDIETALVLKTQALTAPTLLHGFDLQRRSKFDEGGERRRADRLLNVSQTAVKLGVKPDWIYRHHSHLPFRVRQGTLLRFSELGIEDYIRRRLG
jgi:predicted DNA-binding transcriptional regulator AlpA